MSSHDKYSQHSKDIATFEGKFEDYNYLGDTKKASAINFKPMMDNEPFHVTRVMLHFL